MRMTQVIRVERCVDCGRMQRIVDSEFDHRQELTLDHKRVDVFSKESH